MAAVEHSSDKTGNNSLVRTAHPAPQIEQAGGMELVHEPELVDFAVVVSNLKARGGHIVAAARAR